MNCGCQIQINERVIEPNSKAEATFMYTFGVLLISGIKEQEQREDGRTGKQPNSWHFSSLLTEVSHGER